MRKSVKHDGSTRDSYFYLVKDFPLISIQDYRALSKAQAMVDSLFAKGALDRGEETYLDALSDLIAVYEDQHVVVEHPGDSAVLAHLMEANRINQLLVVNRDGRLVGALHIHDLTRAKVI